METKKNEISKAIENDNTSEEDFSVERNSA